jgi:hypothetical protein
MDGKVQLPFLKEPPGELNRLFNGLHLESKHFLDNARAFNSAFAFTSIGAKIDRSVTGGGGPPVFKIQGALYHKHGQILPNEDGSAKYAQIYFHQSQQTQLERRMANNIDPITKMPRLNQRVMSDIQVNDFVFLKYTPSDIYI